MLLSECVSSTASTKRQGNIVLDSGGADTIGAAGLIAPYLVSSPIVGDVDVLFTPAIAASLAPDNGSACFHQVCETRRICLQVVRRIALAPQLLTQLKSSDATFAPIIHARIGCLTALFNIQTSQ
jgi:hypothetical protein